MTDNIDSTKYLDFDFGEEYEPSSMGKYLVAFYSKKDDDDDSWCGTGVIVGDYLITVAHIMIDKKDGKMVEIEKLFFKYNDMSYCLDSSNIIYDGRKDLYKDTDNIHHDLIVAKIDGISSPLVLNATPIKLPLDVYSLTLIPPKIPLCPNHFTILESVSKHYDEEMRPSTWENCLLVTGNYKNGNSGTPIFRENTIFGLLIEQTISYCHKEDVYNFIDSSYICKVIERINK